MDAQKIFHCHPFCINVHVRVRMLQENTIMVSEKMQYIPIMTVFEIVIISWSLCKTPKCILLKRKMLHSVM